MISKGSVEENRKRIKAYQIKTLLLAGDSNVSETYRAKWTPAAVFINLEGLGWSQMQNGVDNIRSFVDHAVTLAGIQASGGRGIPEIVLGKSLFRMGDPAPRFFGGTIRHRFFKYPQSGLLKSK